MLSILIVNWNTRELLRECLISILEHPPRSPFEVVIVDNASTDGSAEMVAQEFPLFKLIVPGSNTGYAHGNNLAFNDAHGDILLTLNPDTVLEDDSLDRAMEVLSDKAEYGVLGVRLVTPDQKTQKSVRGFPTILGVFGAITKLDRIFPKTPLGSYTLVSFDYAEEGPAPQPMGTFLMFKRAALESVGDPRAPFDEDFPIFFNEVDLLYRLATGGWPCWYTPKAHVLHHHGASTKQARKSMIWESHNSLQRYFMKHLRGLARIALPFTAGLLWASAFVRAKGYHAGFRSQRHNL